MARKQMIIKIKKSLYFSIVIFFLVSILGLIFVPVVMAACPSGSSCMPSVRWDKPAGCDIHYSLDGEYFWCTQKYDEIWKSCDAGCGWNDTGTICLGCHYEGSTVVADHGFHVPFAGGCCSGSGGGGGDCSWSCSSGGDESLQYTGEAVCAPCDMSTHWCARPNSCNTGGEPSSNNPKGYHDSSSCDYSYGWTCDADSYSTPLFVNLYANGSYIGSALANVTAEQGVADACGGYAAHRFNFPTPEILKDGATYSISATALNSVGGGSNFLLTGSPKSITCAPPSCQMALAPGSIQIGNNSTTPFIASVTNLQNGTVTNVTFVSNNTGIATVSPASVPSVQYSTIATSVGVGSANITASAIMSGSVRCSATSVLNVINANPWWQVKDGDVTTNGDLRTGAAIPAGNYFDLAGAGGYPGVPAYGGSTNLINLTTSTIGWLANSTYSSSKVFNSNYFFNAVPEEAVINPVSTNSVAGSFFASGGTPSFGYYWYVYDATATHLDLNITSAANLGSRKVILLVKGANLNLGGNINLTKGNGFFLAVTTGNIIVSPAVGGGGAANLEGIYVSDGIFSTGSAGAGVDTELWVRGSVAAFGGMNLQRNLVNNSGPAEFFELAPDQELLFPTKLSYYPSAWREIAP